MSIITHLYLLFAHSCSWFEIITLDLKVYLKCYYMYSYKLFNYYFTINKSLLLGGASVAVLARLKLSDCLSIFITSVASLYWDIINISFSIFLLQTTHDYTDSVTVVIIIPIHLTLFFLFCSCIYFLQCLSTSPLYSQNVHCCILLVVYVSLTLFYSLINFVKYFINWCY